MKHTNGAWEQRSDLEEAREAVLAIMRTQEALDNLADRCCVFLIGCAVGFSIALLLT
jgi:hypothetical protein